MISRDNSLSIGAIAERTGLAVSAVRFYDDQGLISSTRAPSGHRRFHRSTIRRVSFIRICQQLGYSLAEIDSQLAHLPAGGAPSESDWAALAAGFSADLQQRIEGLSRLRDKLDGCIGCGCLSLQRCQIYNPDDIVAERGAGPRHLLEPDPPT